MSQNINLEVEEIAKKKFEGTDNDFGESCFQWKIFWALFPLSYTHQKINTKPSIKETSELENLALSPAKFYAYCFCKWNAESNSIPGCLSTFMFNWQKIAPKSKSNDKKNIMRKKIPDYLISKNNHNNLKLEDFLNGSSFFPALCPRFQTQELLIRADIVEQEQNNKILTVRTLTVWSRTYYY